MGTENARFNHRNLFSQKRHEIFIQRICAFGSLRTEIFGAVSVRIVGASGEIGYYESAARNILYTFVHLIVFIRKDT